MRCFACGEILDRTDPHGSVGVKPYCVDCYDEVVHGKIRNQNITFFGGGVATEDDIGPWQENAIRALEDNQE